VKSGAARSQRRERSIREAHCVRADSLAAAALQVDVPQLSPRAACGATGAEASDDVVRWLAPAAVVRVCHKWSSSPRAGVTGFVLSLC
jgi:hypothetical protein